MQIEQCLVELDIPQYNRKFKQEMKTRLKPRKTSPRGCTSRGRGQDP